MWEFWIDVGGTFTDCIARSPNDDLVTVKVLSSGTTKGQVESILDDKRFTDSSRLDDPPKFWVGYQLRILSETGAVISTAEVSDFDHADGTLTLAQPISEPIHSGTRYELSSSEEAPILAIRTVSGPGRPATERSISAGQPSRWP